MAEWVLNPIDRLLVQRVIEHFNSQLDEGLKNLDKKLKDVLNSKTEVEDINQLLENLTIYRFNLIITKDYVNSEFAFIKHNYKKHILELAVRKEILNMILKCDNITDRIIEASFSGDTKYEYSMMFIEDPINCLNFELFDVFDEALFNKKGIVH